MNQVKERVYQLRWPLFAVMYPRFVPIAADTQMGDPQGRCDTRPLESCGFMFTFNM